MTRVLVTGARGLLGAAIVREFARDCDVRALDRAALDITRPAAVADAVRDIDPALIINCAAFNDVDGAEERPQEALAVNSLGVLGLVRAAEGRPCTMVHYSSDFVFDGETTRPYTEEDEAHPRSFYGLSKLLGEWLAAQHPRTFVLRVESLFGEAAPGGTRLGSLTGIVRRIQEGQEVPVFVDRTVSPSYTADVARATRALVEGGAAPGLYHCVNGGAASWADIATEAASILGLPLRARPLTLDSAGLRAARPRYCALSNVKLAGTAFRMPAWQDALRRHLAGVNRRAPEPAS